VGGWLGCGVTVAVGNGEGAGVSVGRDCWLVPPRAVELMASSRAFPVAAGLCDGAPAGLCEVVGDGDSFWPGETVLVGVLAGDVVVPESVGVGDPESLGVVVGVGLPVGDVLGELLGLVLLLPELPGVGEQLGLALPLPPPPALPLGPPGPVLPAPVLPEDEVPDREVEPGRLLGDLPDP